MADNHQRFSLLTMPTNAIFAMNNIRFLGLK